MTDSDTILAAIKATQELRASVAHVFERLSEGMRDTSNPIGKEKAFLAELQQNLLVVNRDLGEIEKCGTILSAPTAPLSLGNSSILTLDPVLDKSALFTKLLQSYKWSSKLHDHASIAGALLHQNSLKRSQTSTPLSNKRLRKAHTNSYAVSAQSVDNLIVKLDNLFPDMTISPSRPLGSPAVLQITLGRTLKAIVVLRGLIIEWVTVRSYGEPFHAENGKLDIWSKSRYAVFQKVTDHTSAAMLHFYSPFIPELAVKSFLSGLKAIWDTTYLPVSDLVHHTWFHSYGTLFTTPCHKCNKYLQDHLPPTWRDFRTLDPYHEHCRP